MFYYNNGKIVREKEFEVPDFMVEGTNEEKYMGIRITERDEMTNEERIDMIKDFFDKEAEIEGVKVEEINFIRRGKETFYNPYTHDSFNAWFL